MTVGGKIVMYDGADSNQLTAYYIDELNVQHTVFTAEVHHDGSYAVNMLASLDSVTEFELSNLGVLGISGGNGTYFTVGSATVNEFGDDILISAAQPGGTVNTAKDDIGSGSQWIVSETGLRFDFVNNITSSGAYSDHRTLTGVAIGLADVSATGGDQAETNVMIGLYVDSNTTSTGNKVLTENTWQSIVTSISFVTLDAQGNAQSITLGQDDFASAVGSGLISFVDNYDISNKVDVDSAYGLVIHGVAENTSVGITTNSVFDAVELVNYDGFKFSVNSVGGAYLSTSPVNFELHTAVVDGDGDISQDGIITITANAVITGTDGTDVLHGGNYDDLVIGDGGSDILTGGDGHDLFAWKSGDADNSIDHITDFTIGQDKLDLGEILNNTSGESLDNYLHFTRETGNAVLQVFSNGTGNTTVTPDLTIVMEGLGTTDQELIDLQQYLIHQDGLIK
jgi:Ca2+-binding RTX toxin-like protein